jgi:hypothetical protein
MSIISPTEVLNAAGFIVPREKNLDNTRTIISSEDAAANPPMTLEHDVIETDVRVRPSSPVNEIQEARSEAFIELVKSGTSPTEAARELGTSLKELKRDPLVLAAAKQLVQSYRFTAAERKELVQATRNKILLTGTNQEALAAAKQIGEESDMGMSQGSPQTTVNIGIFSQDAQDIFSRLPDMPGLDTLMDD